MRVLLAHKDFEPFQGGGGTARHIHGLATALAGLGYEVRVMAPRPLKVEQPYETVAASLAGTGRHIAWADVVHVHGARSLYAATAALRARLLGKPFFYTAHCWYAPRSSGNAILKAFWDQTAERFLLAKGFRTIILTDDWRTFLAEKHLPVDRLMVVPNCVLAAELDRVRPMPPVERLEGAPAILSVGRLSPEKRGRDLIEALTRPALATAHAHFVGKGADRPELEALARQRGVADRVRFYGFVPDATVAQMTAGSDVFVLASEEEGLPTILLEMIMAGIPIVCTQIPGNRAITDPAGIVSTYPVGDGPALARRLLGFAAAPITPAMQDAVRRLFTWEGRAHEIGDAYAAAIRAAREARS